MESKEGKNASLAELLCALSFVSDIGMGQAMEHGLKTAYIGGQIADALRLPLADRQAVFYGALLKDAGCTACASVVATLFDGDDLNPRSDCILLRADSAKDAVSWFWRHGPADVSLPSRMAKLFSFLTECKGVMKESMAAHCEVGEMFARRLGLPEAVQTAVRFSWERWDGKGLAYGARGPDMPVAARVLHLAQVVQAAQFFGTRTAAEAIAKERRGTDFDPGAVDAFINLATSAHFWDVLEAEDQAAQGIILQARPKAAFDELTPPRIEEVCYVLADFADAKSRLTWNHSLNVMETSVAIGKCMRIDDKEMATLKRAALVHDLGKAAVPVGILDKGHDFSVSEWERFRLHPYYTERVLSRIPPLNDLAAIAGAHHEQFDGAGYHRRLAGDAIPIGSRILAVADAYSVLMAPEGSGEAEPALAEIRALAGARFDGDCCDALEAAVLGTAATGYRRPKNSAGLTDREVEVLGLAATGLSNREIGHALVISDKTVEHHLEHVFNKLGVTSRTAAVVFAVHNGLAP